MITYLVRISQERGIPLIVDSAHGSHWAFHPNFPQRPETAGAQIVTLSIHKTGLALGQGSLALFNNMSIVPRLYEVVSLGFVSTSFSTVILSSLFDGIWLLAERGIILLGEQLEMAQWTREQINQIDGLHSFGLEEVQPGFANFDPLRLTVDVTGIGLTGYEVEELLIDTAGIYAEMATLQNILFLINPGIGWDLVRKLVDLLRQAASIKRSKRQLPRAVRPTLHDRILTPREAFYYRKRSVLPVKSAVGKVSAETISAYPPGSAVVVAGELLTEQTLEYLGLIRSFGGTLKGAGDPDFKTVQVLDV